MNYYDVKLRKDLKVDILSNTGWYLAALGQWRAILVGSSRNWVSIVLGR